MRGQDMEWLQLLAFSNGGSTAGEVSPTAPGAIALDDGAGANRSE
jgi:hypothetical protein